jgi:hypothetical protein
MIANKIAKVYAKFIYTVWADRDRVKSHTRNVIIKNNGDRIIYAPVLCSEKSKPKISKYPKTFCSIQYSFDR